MLHSAGRRRAPTQERVVAALERVGRKRYAVFLVKGLVVHGARNVIGVTVVPHLTQGPLSWEYDCLPSCLA